MVDVVKRLIHDMYARDARSGEKSAANQRANLQLIREFNRLVVLNYIREHGPVARVEVAKRTGLSRTTVSSIMDELLQEGFVHEGDFSHASPEGGRRAILVHFNADIGYAIGIEVEQTRMTLLLTDLSARIIAQRSGPFKLEAGPKICLPLLIAEVRTFVVEAAISWDQVVGIGLGIPGPLDAQRHTISPPGMPSWDGVDVWQTLHEAFTVPLYMDNDANMGAIGEARYGAGRGYTQLAYVIARVGIGSGIIFNGNIYRGHNGSAGELGHITIDEDGSLCVCGNRGCLETLASTQAVVADALQGHSLARLNGQPCETNPSIDPAKVDISEIIKRAQNGDAASIAAIERAGEHIGVALGSLINLFNPVVVIIDGSIASAGNLLLAPLRRATAASSLPAAWRGTRILPSELNNTAVALGGVSNVIDAAFAVSMLNGSAMSAQ